ncbi:MAG TPA: phosphopantothenoylcysteine decarboxylase [Verrucomicrobiales bacterium]|nr:phosphopantothenoylcysteine decarboxylase [Verrucomicrobiales bacterium]
MHFLITAGPTREAIDPVRFLSNRSSGRMGFALAGAAAAAGHAVTLIAGPVHLDTPAGVSRVDVTSAQEMYEAVRDHLPAAQTAIFSAAVADYRPAHPETQKIKKSSESMTLTLERTPDILGSVRSVFGWRGFLIGFAAETENLLHHARGKLERKGCDLLVANDVSRPGSGFDSTENEVTLLFRDGTVRELPRMSKEALASLIVAEVK